jgi:anti-anti-sigma factor
MNRDPSATEPRRELAWASGPGAGELLRVSGFLDAECVRRIEEKTARLEPGTGLVLSLGEVEYLSSTGISEILKLESRFRLVLASPSEAVVQMLRLAEVWSLFRIADSEAQALDMAREAR